LEKERISKEKGFVEVKDLFFSNPKQNFNSIITNGVDLSFVPDGQFFGRGIHGYNASREVLGNALKGNNNNYRSKIIFLCEFLVGRAFIESSSKPFTAKPPLLDQLNYIFYDSMTNIENFDNDYNKKQIFAVYNNAKVYPKYAVHFEYMDLKNKPNNFFLCQG